MKTGNFLLAIAALATVTMSSCSQEEESVVSNNQLSENAVVFGTYLGASRGTVMDLSALKGTGFGVMAYYTGQNVFGTASTPNFMYNQKVEWTGEGDNAAWTYSPLKYWPNNENDKVSFFAYAPYTGTFGTTGITALSANNVAGDPTLTFVMDGDVSKQIDLLYADATGTTTETSKIVDLTKPGVDSRVKFNFKHALSRVSFSRVALIDENENVGLDANTTITIKKVTFSAMNFGTLGTLNLHTGTWDNVSYDTKAYELDTDDFIKDSNVLTSANATTVTEITGTNGNIMFIPVANADEDSNASVTITIEYTVKTKDDNLKDGYSEITNTKTVTVPNTVSFAAGKAYNFILKIGLTSVKVEALVADWPTDETTPKWESKEIEF